MQRHLIRARTFQRSAFRPFRRSPLLRRSRSKSESATATERKPRHVPISSDCLLRAVNHLRSQATPADTDAAQIIEELTEALQASEQRFRQLFELTPSISVQGYNASREVIFWNSASEALYGYSSEQAIGRKLEELIIPKPMRPAVVEAVEQWIHHDIPIPAAALVLEKADGSPCPVYSNHVLFRNRYGEIEMYCLDIDLSSLKETQDHLALLNEQLRTLVDHIPNTIHAKDANGRFLFCNKAYATLLRTNPASIQGTTLADHIQNADRIRREQEAEQEVILSKSAHFVEEELIPLPDGTMGWFQTVRVPMRYPGSNTPGVLTISTDITVRKETENRLKQLNEEREAAMETANALALEAQSANLVKSEFLANLSHELRTPMNGVLGLAELLQDSQLTWDQQECVRSILESGGRMMELVNQLLQLSDIESERASILRQPLDLDAFLEKEASSLRSACHKKHLTFYLEKLDGLPTHIFEDAFLLHRILRNLGENAVKFTHFGSVRWVVGFQQSPAPTLKFRILDSGPGVPDDLHQQIFELFFQRDASLTRPHEGLGLGLALTKHLVNLMGGTITCTNLPEGGACFEVSLPIQVCDAGEKLPTESTVPSNQAPARTTAVHSSSSSARILIVEDDSINRTLATRLVRKLGYHPKCAKDGIEALEMLKAEHFDGLLMDVRMPRMDGLEATRRLRTLDGLLTSNEVPVIAVTAQAYASDRDECLKAGMNDYLRKPFSLVQLEKLLHKWLPK